METLRGVLVLTALAGVSVGCGPGEGGAVPPVPRGAANAPPTANAGEDRIANEGAAVTLTGSGEDRDGTVVSYRWEQVSGAAVEPQNPDAAIARFTAPAYERGASELVFRLTVTDNRGASANDEVSVAVNALPTADAGSDQTVRESTPVTLAGSGGDRDGTIASYRWEQISGPGVALSSPDAATTRFNAPAYASGASELVFRLTVTDDRGAADSDEVTVTILAPLTPEAADPFAHWNDLEPQPWWRESAPYTCRQQEKETSPWLEASLPDLGGSDPLSLIRYFGNGSYLRYGHMGFHGCTPLTKYPDSYHLDPPADPAYYSLGDLDIHVDIARVPAEAAGWHLDDGARVGMSMTEAVALLNTHVAAYFGRVSGDRLRIAFHPGNEFDVPGDGSPDAARNERNRLVGACLKGCEHGEPGGLNRILLSDVTADTGGSAYNGSANFGLATLRAGNMETIVHEMGHGWMSWPHSFAEVMWRASAGDELEPPNPYSNFHDIMSALDLTPILGWDADLPSTLAINRYAAGWIDPGEVALHRDDSATYTLRKPFEHGYQFLVIHSGRRFAFTTLEVLEERPVRFKVSRAEIHDPTAPGGRRARRYEGVLISRYDQSAGTGTHVRFGPALYDRNNPEFLVDVGWGRDDYALVPDGGIREIGGGITVGVARNADGSYQVTVSGGTVAEFERWCDKIWFSAEEYDTGCFLDGAEWE